MLVTLAASTAFHAPFIPAKPNTCPAVMLAGFGEFISKSAQDRNTAAGAPGMFSGGGDNVARYHGDSAVERQMKREARYSGRQATMASPAPGVGRRQAAPSTQNNPYYNNPNYGGATPGPYAEFQGGSATERQKQRQTAPGQTPFQRQGSNTYQPDANQPPASFAEYRANFLRGMGGGMGGMGGGGMGGMPYDSRQQMMRGPQMRGPQYMNNMPMSFADRLRGGPMGMNGPMEMMNGPMGGPMGGAMGRRMGGPMGVVAATNGRGMPVMQTPPGYAAQNAQMPRGQQVPRGPNGRGPQPPQQPRSPNPNFRGPVRGQAARPQSFAQYLRNQQQPGAQPGVANPSVFLVPEDAVTPLGQKGPGPWQPEFSQTPPAARPAEDFAPPPDYSPPAGAAEAGAPPPASADSEFDGSFAGSPPRSEFDVMPPEPSNDWSAPSPLRDSAAATDLQTRVAKARAACAAAVDKRVVELMQPDMEKFVANKIDAAELDLRSAVARAKAEAEQELNAPLASLNAAVAAYEASVGASVTAQGAAENAVAEAKEAGDKAVAKALEAEAAAEAQVLADLQSLLPGEDMRRDDES